MKKTTLGGIEIIAIVLFSSLAFFLASTQYSGITGNFIYEDNNCNPPTTGDWLINSDVTCVNRDIIITGNVNITGTSKFIIEGCNFSINTTTSPQYFLRTYNNSNLTILDSNIIDINQNWMIETYNDSNSNIISTYFYDGVGLHFYDNSNNKIINTSILHNSITEDYSINYFINFTIRKTTEGFDLKENSNNTFINSFIDAPIVIRNTKNEFYNTNLNNQTTLQQYPNNYFYNSTMKYIVVWTNGASLFGNLTINSISTNFFATANRTYPIYVTYNGTNTPVPNRQVNITNSSGDIIWQGTTDSNGYVEATITYVAASASGNKYNDDYNISTNEIQDFGLLKTTPIMLEVNQTINEEPSGPYTTGTLNCNIVNWSDIDGGNDNTDTNNSVYTWYINDENSSTYQVIPGQTTVNLTSEHFDSNDCVICQVEALDVHQYGDLILNSSETCIVNQPPEQPTNNKIRDGVNSWDSTTFDTHDKTPDLNWTVIDNDNDSITTQICIATSSNNRDQSNCVYQYTTPANVFTVTDVTGLDYTGTSVTYYVRLTPNDGNTNGTHLDFSFDLINSIPDTPSNFNTTVTHDTTPTVSWVITDADDGSDNHWPADTLTSHIRINNNADDTLYSTSDSANNNSYTSDSIPWGVTGTQYADRLLDVTIWTTDGNSGTSLNYTTSFTLRDILPQVTDVSLTDTGSYSSCTQSTCALTPVAGSNTSLAVKITAADDDNDCGSVSNATIYLCLNTTICNENIAQFSWYVDDITDNTSNCIYTFSTNKTASDNTPEFWRLPNTYKFYAKVQSNAGARTTDTNAVDDWTYNTLSAIDYPDRVLLGNGTLDLGTWNDGTSLALLINYGNNKLDLQWNTDNPTSGQDTWILNGTDLMIDDDTSYSTDAGNLAAVGLNNTDYYFDPVNGLNVCLADTCNSSLTNETLDTYYHAYPPSGLTAGTYNSTITITLGTH